jgi:hypothetical protein
MQNDREDWTPPSRARSAHALKRAEVVLAMDQKGCTILSSPALSRLSGVSVRPCWAWLKGLPVSQATDRQIRQALGLPLRAA